MRQDGRLEEHDHVADVVAGEAREDLGTRKWKREACHCQSAEIERAMEAHRACTERQVQDVEQQKRAGGPSVRGRAVYDVDGEALTRSKACLRWC